MGDITKLDPIFSVPPGQTASDQTEGSGLGHLDSIFDAPIGPDPMIALRKKQEEAKQGKLMGLPKIEERMLSTIGGGLAGPAIKKIAEYAFPSEEVRAAEGIRKMKEATELQKMQQELINQELLKKGINPADLPGGASKTSGTKWMQNWAGQDKIIEGGVPEAAQAYQRGKPQGKVSGKFYKKFGTSTREPGQPVQSTVDRLIEQGKKAEETAANLAKAGPEAEAQVAAQISKATPGPLQRFGTILKSPYTSGVLGGAGAGLSFYDAYDRYMNGDRSGAVISALGGLGSMATLVPGLQGPGLALSLGSIPVQYLHDYLMQQNAAPQPPLQQMAPQQAVPRIELNNMAPDRP